MLKRLLISALVIVVAIAATTAIIVASPEASGEVADPQPPSTQPAGEPFISHEAQGAIGTAQVAYEMEIFFAGIQAELDRQAAEAAAAEAARQQVAAARSQYYGVTGGSGRCGDDIQCFLECTRAHESDTSGGYGAVSPGGTYRGAYQFLQSTWDAAVAGAGHAEYAGIPPDQVPPEIQDAAAAHLYSVSGNRPWGGRC